MSTAHDGPKPSPIAHMGYPNAANTAYTGMRAPQIKHEPSRDPNPAPAPTTYMPGYESLRHVLDAAYDQAARGKGQERHARPGEGFEQQFIIRGAEVFGIDGLFFQAMKKAEESKRLPHDAAQKEILGAIVYLAAALIFNERRHANAS